MPVGAVGAGFVKQENSAVFPAEQHRVPVGNVIILGQGFGFTPTAIGVPQRAVNTDVGIAFTAAVKEYTVNFTAGQRKNVTGVALPAIPEGDHKFVGKDLHNRASWVG